MMKKHSFILWAALTMTSVFTACTNEDSLMTEQTVTKTATIHATIEGDLGSRVALTDDVDNRVVKVDWKQGDDFKINVNGTDYTFTYTANNEFECSDVNFPETFTEAGTVTATYPATTPTGYANQPGTLDGAAALLTMTATLDVESGENTGNLNLNFKHENSIVKMTLSNNDFKEKNVTWVTLKSGDAVVATATGTFMDDDNNGSIVAYFAVEPQAVTNISIVAVCEYKHYTATLSDNNLETGKLYNVTKAMTQVTPMGEKTAATAVKGDFAMKDGSFISKDVTLSDEQKTHVKGIVFWTTADMNTAANAQTPAKLTDDEIMAKDFPNCTHGLIVSLKDVSQSTKWQESYTKIADWQTNTFNADDEDKYKSIASGIAATDLINYILGYQNTKILKAYNASLESGSANMVLPVSLLDDFSNQNPAPANTTGWFIPSVKELHMLCYKDVADVWNADDNAYTDTKVIVNASLEKVGGTKFGSSYYWSSSESADYESNAFRVGFNRAHVNRYSKSYTCRVRAVCAY